MPRLTPAAILLLVATLAPAFTLPASSADAPAAETQAKPKAPGMGDPGKLTGIVIDTGRTKDGVCVISGRDSGQQLVVTGNYDSGQTRDWTGKATYETTPPGLIKVDAAGLITPIAEGEATLHVVAEPGIDASLKIKVTNLVQDLPVNFREPDHAGLYQVRLQRRRLPRQVGRPERLPAVAARFRAEGRLRVSGEGRARCGACFPPLPITACCC